MFYYYLSTDSYEDYYEIPLMHEKEYSKEEFIDIAKEASSRFEGHYGIDGVSKVLIDEFGFKELNQIDAHFDNWERKWS